MTGSTGRIRGFALAALVAAVLVSTAEVEAQYRYGGRGYDDDGGQGIFVELEGSLANVRNADNVVATIDSGNVVSSVVPPWDDDVAGRLGGGYRWGGNKLFARVWGFAAEQDAVATGALNFAVGPPVGGDDSGTALQVTTEITMNTIDVGWARTHGLGESFDLEWSAAFRYATFEETQEGLYADGAEVFRVAKSNEGEMIGPHVGVRGTYGLERLFFSGGLGFSFLDGELTASSGLTQIAGGTGASFSGFLDDGRSGSIRELDVTGGWRNPGNSLQVYVGWEQAEWMDIAADMVRNFSTTTSPLRDRDSVTVSGFKIGFRYRR